MPDKHKLTPIKKALFPILLVLICIIIQVETVQSKTTLITVPLKLQNGTDIGDLIVQYDIGGSRARKLHPSMEGDTPYFNPCSPFPPPIKMGGLHGGILMTSFYFSWFNPFGEPEWLRNLLILGKESISFIGCEILPPLRI